MKLQKLGGYSAIASVCFYIIQILMRSRNPHAAVMDAAGVMARFSARPAHVIVLELVFSISSILAFVMFLALHERMQAGAVHLTRIMLIAASVSAAAHITASIGLFMGGMIIVPVQDVSAFRALLAMVMSLVYLVYHTHGWACLLLGCAVLKTRSFSGILGWLFVFIGIVQIPTTIVPQLARGNLIASLLSGLGTVWIGIALLRQKQPQPAAKEMAASR